MLKDTMAEVKVLAASPDLPYGNDPSKQPGCG